MSKPLELTIHHAFKDRHGEDWYVWKDTCVRPWIADMHGETKRLTDAELAAEFHAFVMSDHKYPADPDEYGDDEWEAYSREFEEAEKTILRFAMLPHYDEAPAG